MLENLSARILDTVIAVVKNDSEIVNHLDL